MGIITFRIGEPRRREEGLRLGTVRYLPRGVRKQDYARLNYFDVWLPLLAPSAALLRWYRTTEPPAAKFFQAYVRELETSTNARQTLQFLAHLSLRTGLAVGCYCEDPQRCHRTALMRLLDREIEALGKISGS